MKLQSLIFYAIDNHIQEGAVGSLFSFDMNVQ